MTSGRANEVSYQVIGAAIEVHRALGPGLLESAYEECLAFELNDRGLRFARQLGIPLEYKGVHLEVGFRADLVIESLVVVELKAVEQVIPIHEAQLMSYMRLGRWPIGLILNFNVEMLKEGIHRRVINFED